MTEFCHKPESELDVTPADRGVFWVRRSLGKRMAGVLLAAAFAVTGLTACGSGVGESPSQLPESEGEDGPVEMSLAEGTPLPPPGSKLTRATVTGR